MNKAIPDRRAVGIYIQSAEAMWLDLLYTYNQKHKRPRVPGCRSRKMHFSFSYFTGTSIAAVYARLGSYKSARL